MRSERRAKMALAAKNPDPSAQGIVDPGYSGPRLPGGREALGECHSAHSKSPGLEVWHEPGLMRTIKP
jgi:hypothetical protein